MFGFYWFQYLHIKCKTDLCFEFAKMSRSKNKNIYFGTDKAKSVCMQKTLFRKKYIYKCSGTLP